MNTSRSYASQVGQWALTGHRVEAAVGAANVTLQTYSWVLRYCVLGLVVAICGDIGSAIAGGGGDVG